VGSVRSWSHLCRLFTSNFHATCTRLGVDWDLASVIQKKGESLWEFIQRFCNKRNIIPEVNDKSIVMFFKKGLRDLALIQKLAMKNPKTSEAMFTITNSTPWPMRHPSTLGNRRRKGTQAMQTSLARPRATTRRGKRIIPSMWWNGCDATRSTSPSRGNLKAS
jgi:hypothetical protein